MNSTQLMREIRAFSTKPRADRLPSRLRQAIRRVRDHICGVFGVKASEVTDAHVAAFVQKLSFPYTYHNMSGIGYSTEKALKQWAKRQIS